MKKALAHIRNFALSLAGLILFAHLIIPHDHHIVDSLSNRGTTCPESGETPAKNHGFPAHCHAFNDLLTERALKIIIDERMNHSDTAFRDPGDTEISTDESVVCRFTHAAARILYSSDPEFASLRAPPAQA